MSEIFPGAKNQTYTLPSDMIELTIKHQTLKDFKHLAAHMSKRDFFELLEVGAIGIVFGAAVNKILAHKPKPGKTWVDDTPIIMEKLKQDMWEKAGGQ